MTVRTDCLVHDSRAYTATVSQDIATVPSGEVWLVRAWYVEHKGGAASNVAVVHVRSGTTVRASLDVFAGAGVSPHAGQFLALEAGDIVRINSTASVTVGIALYGSRLVTT